MTGALWRIEMLGGLRVLCVGDASCDGGELHALSYFRTRKAGSLLACLAIEPAREHPRELLAEMLWPGCEPDLARNRLRVTLAMLKAQLEGCCGEARCRPLLVARRHSIGLDAELLTTDVAELEGLASRLSQPQAQPDLESGQRLMMLRRAVELYAGPLLPGFYEDWIPAQEQRLEDLFARILAQSVEAEATLGAGRALDLARRGVALLPGREQAHLILMRLLDRLGQPAEALRHAREMERLLQEQDGSPPSARARALAEHIAQSLRSPAPAAATSRPALYGSESPDAHSATPGVAPSAKLLLPLAPTRFHGREDEMRRLLALLQPPWAHVAPAEDADASASNALEEAGAVGPGRLLSLIGAGGSGKSRLALEAAWQLAQAWRGAVLWVPLADVTSAARLGEALLDAVGTSPRTRAAGRGTGAFEHIAQQVARELRGRPALLLLDNFEQLIPHAVPLVEACLAHVPGLCIVTTSRRRLDAIGEREWLVSPLPTPPETKSPEAGMAQQVLEGTFEAPQLRDEVAQAMRWACVRLWVDRAQAARADFELSPANARAVLALCRRLDGLPLALELSAARAGVLSPAQMLARLEHRLKWMKSRAPSLPERQRTLHASLEWSYRLLAPEAQKCFRSLGAFRRGWTLEAAEEVCDAADVADTLQELRSCSLLESQDLGSAWRVTGSSGDSGGGKDARSEMRFGMLETVREFALDKLEAEGEAHEVLRRHAIFFRDLCDSQWEEAQAAETMRRQASQRRHEREEAHKPPAHPRSLDHDIALALHLLSISDHYWADRPTATHPADEQALERAFASAEPIAPRLISSVLGVAAFNAWKRGDYARGREHAARRLDLMRSEGDMASEGDILESAWAIFHMANCALGECDLQASGLFEEALALFTSLEHIGSTMPLCLAWTLDKLGDCAYEQGDAQGAFERYRQSGEAFASCGDRDGVASSLAQRAEAARALGRLEEAARLMDQSEAIERELGDDRAHPWRRLQRGRIELALGHFESSHHFLSRALSAFHTREEMHGVLQSLLALATLAVAREQWRRGAILLCAEEWGRESRAMLLPVSLRATRHQAEIEARAALSEDDWQHARATGHALAPNELLLLALQDGAPS